MRQYIVTIIYNDGQADVYQVSARSKALVLRNAWSKYELVSDQIKKIVVTPI